MDERVSILVCELPLGETRLPVGVLASAVRWVVPIEAVQDMSLAHWPGWGVDLAQCHWGLVLATDAPTWLPVGHVREPVMLTPRDVHPVPSLLTPWARRHRVLAFYIASPDIVPVVHLTERAVLS